KPSVARKDVDLMLRRKARGWKNGSRQWEDREWKAMRAGANLKTWPNVNRPGITLRATDLREMPTHQGRYSKATPDPAANPFDNFQYSRLPVGMPVLLCHMSADKRWYYAETPFACGWIDAKDLAPVSDSFAGMWESFAMAAVVRENVVLGGLGQSAGIGVVLPMSGESAVMVPVKGADGQARMQSAEVAPGSIEPMPLAMTPAAAARLGNAMMGQKYGWGGMLNLRDCSAMTRDLLTPFGIWLPRNSQAQARRGERIPLSALPSAAAREREVLQSGVPFASLVTLKGHVVLYVGRWKGRAAILHDLWGIRVDEPEGEDDRLIVGRIVVTSMTPGRELPNLHNKSTIGDRFHTLTILGGSPR
ncbi:MAG: SH3 domain-containing protein, partial [Desulfovibrionaceae bacterium]|nr:SH3 domain-containing protein [Desulfovibrionaceae bacterium]